ncbi:uncharacterized protein LOC113229095 [Hyposmocoma kahamanoa]|uniref:uncharacterized protein LOC113229095 n=1 Tax=Hyposmocoma kahamanoa TaxID=1477025 RepID=UPI000E6D74B5|nr:uncharacterized protein LOC113229095 [Hyposmocoma kahamanoa]
MVLLSPSIGALRRLLKICESYAVAHGLRYNALKSECMVFKAGTKTYTIVPSIDLGGTPLKQTKQFKYLGHRVTEDLCDNADVERERRALAVRGNMLARSLWVSYTRRTYGALRIQYNNAFRMLFRLPPFCSASTMFAEKHVDDFYAIMRKRSASLLRRMRLSTNSILSTLVERWESPMLGRWMRLHTAANA